MVWRTNVWPVAAKSALWAPIKAVMGIRLFVERDPAAMNALDAEQTLIVPIQRLVSA